MMMRINLLPSKQVKTRRGQQSQQMLYLAAVLLVVTLIGNYLWYSSRDAALTKVNREVAALNQQIAEKARIIKEVESINARRSEVEKKLAVLEGLRANKSGPVKMMDALARATVDRVWLREFTQDAKGVKVVGSAISNEDVADFMRGLSNMVWTPKGMGRLVDQRPGAKSSRVELVAAQGGVVEEFPVAEIRPFFRGIDLKKSEAKITTVNKVEQRRVEFELAMSANYGA